MAAAAEVEEEEAKEEWEWRSFLLFIADELSI